MRFARASAPLLGHRIRAGTIHIVLCDACRTIDVQAWDGHRRSWRITCVDPSTFAA